MLDSSYPLPPQDCMPHAKAFGNYVLPVVSDATITLKQRKNMFIQVTHYDPDIVNNQVHRLLLTVP